MRKRTALVLAGAPIAMSGAAAFAAIAAAQASAREAMVALPETVRPTLGSEAEVSAYGGNGRRATARLRGAHVRTAPDNIGNG